MIVTQSSAIGFKETDAGLIPKDWEARPFTGTVRIAKGQVDPKKEPYRNMILVAPDHIESGTGRLLNPSTAAEQHAISGKYIFESGDIVYSKIRPYLRKAILAKFRGLCSADMYPFTAASDVAPAFIFAQLLGHRFSCFAESISVRSGIPKINREELSTYFFALPSLPEQTKIANALSDTDTLIENLEILVAKKKAIKQGAMQELLTGKRRLPGFSGEWDKKFLGEIGEISSSGVNKKIVPGENPVKLVNYLDVYRRNFIYSNDLNHWVTAPKNQAMRCEVKKGDIFFTPSSETRDDIAISAVAMEDIPDAAYSYHVVRLRLFEKENWDLKFLAYVFKTREFFNQAETLCDGSGTRYVISQPKFRKITVNVPPPPEQAAISSILFSMDKEIGMLQQKLSKINLIKRGMMQVLITGKIRLPKT